MQVKEAVGRQMSERAADDRIKRFPGECDPGKAWPLQKDMTENSLEDQIDKIAETCDRVRRNLANLQKKCLNSNSKNTGLPTLSEGESFNTEGSATLNESEE